MLPLHLRPHHILGGVTLPVLTSGLTSDTSLAHRRAVGTWVSDRLVTLAEFHVSQVVQLEELLAVRHSVFVVGSAGTGKSQVLRSLHKTYQIMKRRPVWTDLNPKAVTSDELFGIINPATREWKDGESGIQLNQPLRQKRMQ